MDNKVCLTPAKATKSALLQQLHSNLLSKRVRCLRLTRAQRRRIVVNLTFRGEMERSNVTDIDSTRSDQPARARARGAPCVSTFSTWFVSHIYTHFSTNLLFYIGAGIPAKVIINDAPLKRQLRQSVFLRSSISEASIELNSVWWLADTHMFS